MLTLSVALPVLSLIAILQARPPETLPPSRTNWTRLVPLPVLSGRGPQKPQTRTRATAPAPAARNGSRGRVVPDAARGHCGKRCAPPRRPLRLHAPLPAVPPRRASVDAHVVRRRVNRHEAPSGADLYTTSAPPFDLNEPSAPPPAAGRRCCSPPRPRALAPSPAGTLTARAGARDCSSRRPSPTRARASPRSRRARRAAAQCWSRAPLSSGSRARSARALAARRRRRRRAEAIAPPPCPPCPAGGGSEQRECTVGTWVGATVGRGGGDPAGAVDAFFD